MVEVADIEDTASAIDELHSKACAAGEETYIDPSSGLAVFTEVAHAARGKCCGCGCRHCPFKKNCSRASQQPLEQQKPKKSLTRHGKSTVYTRTGDGGKSSLFNGERASKASDVFDALGTVDELNSLVGLAHSHCIVAGRLQLAKQLEHVMSRLLDIGSHLATPRGRSSETKTLKTGFGVDHVDELETWIDFCIGQLPNLTTFILPTGGVLASTLHVCRSVCRRAERCVVPLVNSGAVDQMCLKYINRLSDWYVRSCRPRLNLTHLHAAGSSWPRGGPAS